MATLKTMWILLLLISWTIFATANTDSMSNTMLGREIKKHKEGGHRHHHRHRHQSLHRSEAKQKAPAPSPTSDESNPPASVLTCTLGAAAHLLPCLPELGFHFSGSEVGGNWGWSPENCCNAISHINPNCVLAILGFFGLFLPNTTVSQAASTIGACD